jgi:predicted DNA-binding transcriptional regulator AlpA
MKDIDNTEGTAAYLAMTPKGLRNLRYRGEGPPACKVGALVRYRRADVDHWLDEHVDTGLPDAS